MNLLGDKNKTRFFEPQNFEAYQIQIIFNAVHFFSLEIGICLAWLHILFYVSNWILTILLNKISHWLHNRKVRATYFEFYSPNSSLYFAHSYNLKHGCFAVSQNFKQQKNSWFALKTASEKTLDGFPRRFLSWIKI